MGTGLRSRELGPADNGFALSARASARAHRASGQAAAHLRFVKQHAVAGGSAVALPDVREAVRRAAQRADLTMLRAVDFATPSPLEDLGALVLGDHALHLHQKLVLGRL